jgi:hypothetical protein
MVQLGPDSKPVWRRRDRLAVALAVALSVVVLGSGPALAEFEIQEATAEAGSVEIEYRGAEHWGLPAAQDGPLRQSHELELQMGVTDFWTISVTQGLDQPLGKNLDASSLEVETQLALMQRQGDGVALAVRVGYEQALRQGDANQLGFGPILEVAKGPLLLTLDPIFTKQRGEFADQKGGFDYGWQLKYEP